MGRPSALTQAQQAEARQKLAAGVPVIRLAHDYNTTRQTIMRVRQKAITA
ncbi:putative DNA-invertase from lambdoid prophage Rac [Paraburkholderia diazotrophica]|uniref:Putative DNA-invertase from lambdoid prophage Rac n=1 Tax=Paraburkholderia diazotrophica TaxID=667676 RepID=A0A1H6TR22_9BURK|nr:putative DNA-invertase from lambdoid prophage Rac [Paraburkholderia diazotrophica]